MTVETSTPSASAFMLVPRRALRTGVALTMSLLAASLTLLSLPGAARAEEPPPAPGPAPISTEPPPPAPLPPARHVIVLPDDPSALAPTRMHSPALLAGGLVLGAAGLALAIFGTGLAYSAATAPPCTPSEWFCSNSLNQFGEGLGVGIAVSGGGMVAGGIAMAVIGAKRVPILAPTREQRARGVPALALSPQQTTLTWSF